MRVTALLACPLAALALLAGCTPGTTPPTASGSGTPSASASPTPTPTPSASPSRSVAPTRSPVRPSVSPSRSVAPSPARPAGRPLGTSGAYLILSEDENLTEPDAENGCEVHDPDLTDVACGVVRMAGGTATWITGRERTNLPGHSEPRVVVRLYRRLPSGTDSLVYVGYGEPGQWAQVVVRVGSLTGQTRDTLIVLPTFQGSGTMLGYDLVTWRSGQSMRLRAHHPEQPKGRAYVRAAYIAFYGADYADGAPNCCPNYFTHDRVRWDGTQFRLQQLQKVRTSHVPSS